MRAKLGRDATPNKDVGACSAQDGNRERQRSKGDERRGRRVGAFIAKDSRPPRKRHRRRQNDSHHNGTTAGQATVSAARRAGEEGDAAALPRGRDEANKDKANDQ